MPPCTFCGAPAAGIFQLDQGCIAQPGDREQALCLAHIVKAQPCGTMVCVQDLTVDGLKSLVGLTWELPPFAGEGI